MQQPEYNLTKNLEGGGVFDQGELSRRIAFCSVCDMYVQLVTPQESDRMFLANWGKMVRLTEKGGIHQIQNSLGELQYCSNSMRIRPVNPKVKTITLKPLDVSPRVEDWEMER